jgi:arylsulfatase A-like enzyme
MATASIGKWHLGGPGFGPTDQGFDVNIGGDAAGTAKSYYAPFSAQGIWMPGLEIAPDGEYLTDRLTNEALRFIESNRMRRFFLYLPHFAVHTPIDIRPEPSFERALPPPGNQRNIRYAAMLAALDKSVGQIVHKIESLGIARNTLLVFTSDNGGLATTEGPNTPATSNAPLREGKGYLYEGGLRVPLIMAWPGRIAQGGTSDHYVISMDVFATIADVIAAERQTATDGVSLWPVLTGSSGHGRRALFWHYPHYSNQGGRPGGAILEGKYKLIEFFEGGRRELFNVHEDPGESTNLVDKEPEVAQRLAEGLNRWRKEVAAQEMRENPDYSPNPQAEDGQIVLPARTAMVHGVMLRYEPLPHKDTLGFWTRETDWASWEFDVSRAGRFGVEILQGCGPGSGGSTIELAVGIERIAAKIEVTGGFQDFVWRRIGEVSIGRPGRHTLSVKPLTKPGPAVGDLREVRLRPVDQD